MQPKSMWTHRRHPCTRRTSCKSSRPQDSVSCRPVRPSVPAPCVSAQATQLEGTGLGSWCCGPRHGPSSEGGGRLGDERTPPCDLRPRHHDGDRAGIGGPDRVPGAARGCGRGRCIRPARRSVRLGTSWSRLRDTDGIVRARDCGWDRDLRRVRCGPAGDHDRSRRWRRNDLLTHVGDVRPLGRSCDDRNVDRSFRQRSWWTRFPGCISGSR